MSYHIKETWFNGYRCTCCTYTRTTERWVDTTEQALAELPTEFPVEHEYGGMINVTVIDGSTGKKVAESDVSWPPVYGRGDGYTHTQWTLYISEDLSPERVCFIEQIITGTHSMPPEWDWVDGVEPDRPPLKLVTDKTWEDICADKVEQKRLRDIQKAEAQIAEAAKKLASLTGGT